MCLAFSLSTQNHHHQGGVQEGGFRLGRRQKSLQIQILCLPWISYRFDSCAERSLFCSEQCHVRAQGWRSQMHFTIRKNISTLHGHTVPSSCFFTVSWGTAASYPLDLPLSLFKQNHNTQISDLPAYVCTLWVFSVVPLKTLGWGTSLVVQCLRLHAPTAGSSIPGWGTKIPHGWGENSVDWAPTMCRVVERHTFCQHWAEGELVLHRLLMYLCWDIRGSQLELRVFPKMSVLTAKQWWGHLQAPAAWWHIFPAQGRLPGIVEMPTSAMNIFHCVHGTCLFCPMPECPLISHSLLQNITPAPPPHSVLCLLSRYISTWHCPLIC